MGQSPVNCTFEEFDHFSQIFSVSKYIEERNLIIIQWLVDTIEPLLSFRLTAIFSRLNMLKKPSKRDPQQLVCVEKMLLFLVSKKRLWPSYKMKELCKKYVFSITTLCWPFRRCKNHHQKGSSGMPILPSHC